MPPEPGRSRSGRCASPTSPRSLGRAPLPLTGRGGCSRPGGWRRRSLPPVALATDFTPNSSAAALPPRPPRCACSCGQGSARGGEGARGRSGNGRRASASTSLCGAPPPAHMKPPKLLRAPPQTADRTDASAVPADAARVGAAAGAQEGLVDGPSQAGPCESGPAMSARSASRRAPRNRLGQHRAGRHGRCPRGEGGRLGARPGRAAPQGARAPTASPPRAAAPAQTARQVGFKLGNEPRMRADAPGNRAACPPVRRLRDLLGAR